MKPRLRIGPKQPFWDVAGRHLPCAVLGGATMLAASLLPLRPPRFIACWFLALTGHPCPFCGMTRAFTAMGHGNAAAAWAESPLGALLYATIAIVTVVSVAALAIRRKITLTVGLSTRAWVMLLATAVLANWIYRWRNGLQ